MLITALVVGSLVQECITINASDISDLESEYPYMYWIADEKLLIVSKKPLSGKTVDSSNGILIRNIENNSWIQTETFEYYILQISGYRIGDCYRLYYNDVTGWEARQPDELREELTTTTIYTAAYGSTTLSRTIYTNGIALPSPWTSAGNTLPSGIPPFDSIDDAINEALNATTWVSGEANDMISNLQNQQNRYENGQLSKDQYEMLINVYNETFIDLSDNPSNTIADQIAVNNGLTAIQTAQDKLLSDETIKAITDILDAYNIQHTITQQDNGFTPEVLSELCRQYLYEFTSKYLEGIIPYETAVGGYFEMIQLFTPMLANPELTEADKYVLSGVIDFANQQLDFINSAGDLDEEIADAMESSDSEEKEYLQSVINETTKNIGQLKSDVETVITDKDANEINQNIITPLLDNILIKNLLPIAALFMVICVTLGTRYRL